MHVFDLAIPLELTKALAPDLVLMVGAMLLLLVAIIWLGVYPKPVLDRMRGSATAVVESVRSRSGAQAGLALETR